MSRSGDDADPFTALRRQMNRLFDDAVQGFGSPEPWRDAGANLPAVQTQPSVGDLYARPDTAESRESSKRISLSTTASLCV
jgi:hypothetical protein